MASKRSRKESNSPIKVGENDIFELQCIVCHEDNCELYIELKLSNYQIVVLHSRCMILNGKR